MKSLFLFLVIMSCLTYTSAHAVAKKMITFNLSSQKIDRANIDNYSVGRYGIVVHLKEPYKTLFSQLTRANIGHHLSITVCSETLISPFITSTITSGAIHLGTWDSEKDAKHFSNELLANDGDKLCVQIKELLRARFNSYGAAQSYVNKALKYLRDYEMYKSNHFLNDAIVLINKAIDADNQYYLAYYWKAFILSKQKKNNDAISTLWRGIIKCGKHNNYTIANLYMFKGILEQKNHDNDIAYRDYDKAIEIYDNRLKSNPKDWNSLMSIAQALSLMNKRGEAIDRVNSTIDRYPHEIIPKQLLKELKRFNVQEYLEKY